ncbi:hypothetical protein RUM43_007437 [Polyplax serrata]|uniref:Solute carrier family 3 member 2 N-terminal domain-containing protein n=1 Tax=Polyplax serrata TaxID=468196 RepID=A0AAN8S7V2_POLSC
MSSGETGSSGDVEMNPSTGDDRIGNDFENGKHQSSFKLLPVENQSETSKDVRKTNGLSKLELSEFVNDPFWVKLRRTLLCLTILLFLTTFIVSILIIVYTPACEPNHSSKLIKINSNLDEEPFLVEHVP